MANAMRVASQMSRKRSSYSDESKVFRGFLRSRSEPSESALESVIVTAVEQVLQRRATDAELKRYLEFLKQSLRTLDRDKGLQTTLAALLLHPQAVFRFELGHRNPDEFGRVRLAPGELAYAIAYAVTDKSPDSEIMHAARDGQFESANAIGRHVQRLIDAEQASRQATYRKPGVGRRYTAPMLRFFQEYFGYTRAPQVFKDIATKRKAGLGGNYSPEALVSDTNLLVLHCLEEDSDVLRKLLTTELSFVSIGRGRWNGLTSLKERAQETGRTGNGWRRR